MARHNRNGNDDRGLLPPKTSHTTRTVTVRPDPLREARSKALLGYLTSVTADGLVWVDEYFYFRLGQRGLTRAAVDRSLSDLARGGRIALEARQGAVVARLLGDEPEDAPASVDLSAKRPGGQTAEVPA